MNDINLFFIQSQTCLFQWDTDVGHSIFIYWAKSPCRLCLPMQIQIMTLVTKSAIFNKPTPKMLLWLHLAELFIEKKIIIEFLEVHTINIWGPIPHGIVLISTGSHGIRPHFSPEKCSIRTPSCFWWNYEWIWIMLHVAIGSTCTNTHARYQSLAPNICLKMTITDAQSSVRTPCNVRIPIWKTSAF